MNTLQSHHSPTPALSLVRHEAEQFTFPFLASLTPPRGTSTPTSTTPTSLTHGPVYPGTTTPTTPAVVLAICAASGPRLVIWDHAYSAALGGHHTWYCPHTDQPLAEQVTAWQALIPQG
jgi:hypothetical protein